MFDWGLSLECVLVVRAPSSLEVRGYSSTTTTKSVLGQLSHRGKVLSLRVSLSVSPSPPHLLSLSSSNIIYYKGREIDNGMLLFENCI